jgi:tRNA pseudouridine32 synthase/23S rRNA pseudouridine746 synthase
MARLQKERHERSIALQQWLFRQFVFLNALGEEKALPELFHPAVPPSGAGECCAPRLLQAAYKEGLQPLCMAEFWVGASPIDEIRHDGHFYPACNRKCRPILRHLLKGLNVEPNPLLADHERLISQLHIIYNNEEMAVVSKPAGMLSVPGKDDQPSVQEVMRQKFPQATGPLIVHRLDMDTSGLMLISLTEEKYHELQDLFLHRRIHKVYHALLEKEMSVGQEGDISLPLRPDFNDRPRQLVDHKHGKPAQTHYRVLENRDGHALVELHPITGRTHQLRVHCAHSLGLDNPIVGDHLYGKPAERLMLHAKSIKIETPQPPLGGVWEQEIGKRRGCKALLYTLEEETCAP